MKDTRNSITNYIHVNLVYNEIFNKIFDIKELVDNEYQMLFDAERAELFTLFKESIGIRPLTTSTVKNQEPMPIKNSDWDSKPKNGINLAVRHFDEQLQRILNVRNELDIDNLTKSQLDTLHTFSFMLPHMSERLAFEQEKIELKSDRKSSSSADRHIRPSI